ncbi:MAG TPA: ferrochelatase [Gemmataceae bacterium]|nr:ferrochelatase [Gemmataceae bacterium]
MTGILLIQLGTPDAPTRPALKRYLRQFLSDPRVIDVPRWRWWFVLNLFILTTRPQQSAAKYARIWDPVTGSPLLHYTRRQAELLQQAMPDVPVRFGMQIGNPPLADAVKDLIATGVDRLLVLPMYPQYSDTTTASATDALFQLLMRVRKVPALRILPPYFEHPAYLDAMAAIVREELKRLTWEPEHYVYSFHGLPVKYAQAGDPYPGQVVGTTTGLQQRLQFPDGRWTLTYQSLFGRGEWLRPYTDDVLTQLARDGVKRVFVMTPGFTADCLETLDEIGHESRQKFREAGGEKLHQCRCLNDHPEWIAAMVTLLREEGQGWLPSRR